MLVNRWTRTELNRDILKEEDGEYSNVGRRG